MVKKRVDAINIVLMLLIFSFFGSFVIGLLSSDSSSTDEWLMFGRYLNHSGYTNASAPNNITGANITTYTILADFYSSPAFYNGYIYILGQDNLLHQLNATNISKSFANFSVIGSSSASPAIAGGYVYITNNKGVVYQLNASNVSIQVFNFTRDKDGFGSDISRSSPAVWNNSVYVAGYDHKVYQLNASNISQQIAKYTGTPSDNYVHSSPAVANGSVYICLGESWAGGHGLRQLNASDVSQSLSVYAIDCLSSTPLVTKLYVYISAGNQLYQLNASDVSKKINNFTAGATIGGSPSLFNDSIYVGATNNQLYQLNATNVSKKINNFTTLGNVDSKPAVTDLYVLVGSDDNQVYQLNTTNVSKRIANYTTAGDVNSGPTIVKGVVYIGSSDNKLYAFGDYASSADTTPPTFTSIPLNATLEYKVESLGVDFNATDETGFDTYVVNWTTNFTINDSGWLSNNSVLPIGVYYLNITINDTSNNLNSTIYNVTVNDTTPPSPTSISPATATSTETVAQTFSYNVSEANVVTTCSLVLNSSVVVVNTSVVNKTGGTNTLSYTLPVGVFNWSVNCTDDSGNTGNSTPWILTITAPASTDGDDGGGGGLGCTPTSWTCEEWTSCVETENGWERKRNCTSNCGNRKTETGECVEECISNWKCGKWKECVDGKTNRECEDLNECVQSKIEEVICVDDCISNIVFEDWQECEVIYDFYDLFEKEIKLEGEQRRYYEDKNDCVEDGYEEKSCEARVDICARENKILGERYVNIYDENCKELLTVIKDDIEDKDPSLDILIYLEEVEGHCFNRIKDENEKGVDCGGGCEDCFDFSFLADEEEVCETAFGDTFKFILYPLLLLLLASYYYVSKKKGLKFY